MLKRCKKLKASSSGYADVKTTRLNLLEIYFEIFLEELRKLIRLGLIKRYRFEKSNTKALKGKLDFPGNIRKNLIHRERFYTHHQTYDQKHLLHHVLYVALKIIENFTKGTQLFDCCKRLLLMFPDFNTSRLQKEDLDKVIFNRKTTNYRDAYQIARLIILNYSPDINMGNDKMISILFDMNKLWEEFILHEIKTSSYFSDYTVLGQDTKDFFTSNYLQPDIVIENKKTSKKFIFDTKWKCPPSNVATVEDLRQMYTYGRFWKAERTILLYPGHRKTSFESFQTDDSLPDTDELIQHKCKLGYINVFNENKDLSKDIGKSIYHLLED